MSAFNQIATYDRRERELRSAYESMDTNSPEYRDALAAWLDAREALAVWRQAARLGGHRVPHMGRL